ncbi:MAG: DNA-binding protein [Pseudobdellovibrionaceae bacterium]|nr:MAG: DNA-binding protein [Pseudobdellovibrionaceae bacterium]
MHVFESQGRFVVVLEKGEKVAEKLTQAAEEYNWKGGELHAIGALKDVELGYYDAEKKEYIRKTFVDEYELISMHGNVSLKNGDPYVHIHASLGDRDFAVFGGHVFEAVVAVTFEAFVVPFGQMPVREFSPNIGLDLICRLSQ